MGTPRLWLFFGKGPTPKGAKKTLWQALLKSMD